MRDSCKRKPSALPREKAQNKDEARRLTLEEAGLDVPDFDRDVAAAFLGVSVRSVINLENQNLLASERILGHPRYTLEELKACRARLKSGAGTRAGRGRPRG